MKRTIAGVDVGGTTIKTGLFTEDGGLIRAFEVKTPSKEEIGTLWETIAEAVRTLLLEEGLPEESLAAAGVGLPGPIRDDGFLPRCVNLGLKACEPEKELQKLLRVPVRAVNDANAAALGEVVFGAGDGAENAVFLTLGTGVGGGVVVHGQVIGGAHGVGGEIGHWCVEPEETERCNCGGYGCLEQYCSATGIVRTARRILEKSTEASSLRGRELGCRLICDEAKAGDPLAKEALEVFGRYMGFALSHIITMTDPDVIIFGGGVSRAGQILIDVTEKYIEKYYHIGDAHGPIKIAALGNDAGMYGAAALAKAALAK